MGMWTRCVVCACAAGVAACAQGWDVEHDEVAQLTGEFLPAEVRRTLDFDDFGILLANCHFPDMTEWPENGKRRFRTVGELVAGMGEANARALVSAGYANSYWFHTPKGRAALMSALARSFAAGEHAHAAFCISVLTHAISDESALNHPPLLGFFKYSRLPGIDFSMRKVEDGAKNVFGFRSDGHVVHLVREKLRGYVPEPPSGTFGEAVLALGVKVAVEQAAVAAELEGRIAFGTQVEAEDALAGLVAMQVRTIEDAVQTCWKHRSASAALPDDTFERRFSEAAWAAARHLDPARQFVFDGVFDASRNPADPKSVVGVVCEAYAREFGQLSFPGRILTAACARTLRAHGHAVKGLSYWTLAEKGFPDPAEVPCVLACIGGSGYMSRGPDAAFAAAARAYREKGGRLVVVGGEDVRDVTGFAASMRRRGNGEVPVSSAWHRDDAGDAREMSLVAAKGLRRLAGGRFPLRRDPNFDGFCKPVCRMEAPVGEVLLELDNGRGTFPVAVRQGRVAWLPEYALFPYLFVEGDPGLPLHALALDGFGENLLLDALEGIAADAP